ncbi:MAG: hypothetical protein LBL50_03370 [Candidatus Margulisbacteria bacterium]|jgi:hypothetical protein|nr:hypothetical protein [Candidatus Margulisiibacteriota bacterium]
MKRKIILFVLLVLFLSGCVADFETELKDLVKKSNENFPVMVSEETRLDYAVASGHNLHYFYTYPYHTKTMLDLEMTKLSVHQYALQALHETPEAAYLGENNVTIIYHYRDKSGEDLFEFAILPEEYFSSN